MPDVGGETAPLILLGVGATLAVGFLLGGNSRHDDAAAARTDASQAQDSPSDEQAYR